MASETEHTASGRIACAFLGGITGAVYGVMLWAVAFVVTRQSHPGIISWSAIVFGCLGYFYGNLIVEAILALLHFLWGLLNGLAQNWQPIEEDHSESHLRAFLLLGFGTGLVILLWWYV